MTKGKSLGSLLLGSTGLWGVLRGGHDSSVSTSILSDFDESNLSTLNEFLKQESTSQNLHDLVKEYLKTPTGSVVLGNLLSSSLIVKFIDSLDRSNSAFAERLQNDISSLRSSVAFASDLSEELKSKELELFSGQEEYRTLYNTLQQIQKRFSSILVEFLPSFIKSDTTNLKAEDSPDAAIKKLGEFTEAILDDYITYSKPLFVKKLTWHYDNDSDKVKGKIEELFDKDKLPAGTKLPTTANYFFPFISETSEGKFSGFVKAVKAVKDSKDDTDYSKHSDVSEIKKIIPLSEVTNPAQTSQFSIALLELASHAMTYEKWNDVGKGTSKGNLSTKESTEKSKICENNNSDPIPTITAKDTAKISELFCLSKDNNPFTKENPSSDFFYLKKQNGSADKAGNWIVFKDSLGIHAMSLKEGLKDTKDTIKQELLKASKNTSGDYSWDIKRELSKHIEKHFLRIFLEKWDKIFEKSTGSGSSETDDFKDLATKLATALKTLAFKSDLIQLRSNVFKDYTSILNKYPSTINGSLKYINPELGWAGKIPYKPATKQLTKQDTKWKDLEFVFDFWEAIYISEFSKLSSDDLSLESSTKETFTSKFKEYTSQVDTLFNSLNSLNSQKIGKFWKITSGTESLTPINKLSKVQILNLTWIAMLEKRDIVDFLVQKSLKDKLLFFEWKDDNSDDKEKKFKEDNVSIDANTTKSLFADDTDDLGKVIITQYLLNTHKDKLLTTSNPYIYGGEFDPSKLNQTEDLLKWLKKVNDEERQIFGNSHSDLISSRNVSLFSELLAIKWLTENKLENFRKHLETLISRKDFSSFVFSRKYIKDGLCQYGGGSSKDKMKYEPKNSWDLKNKYLGFEEKEFEDRQKCVYKDELFNFSKVKLDGTTETLIGHKGLIYKDLNKIFPEDIAKKLTSKNPSWKDNTSLKSYVDNIKTHEAFDELIGDLKKVFPYIDWGIAEQTHILKSSNWNFSWNSLSGVAGNYSGDKLEIEQRKKILKGFLSQTSKGIFDSNSSWEHLRKIQEKFLNEDPEKYDLLSEQHFTSFNGWVKGDDGNDYLEDSEGNKYLIYMQQVKWDDLLLTKKDGKTTNWETFLKTVTSDLIIKEVVKVAKEKSVQKRALFHYLAETDQAKKLQKWQTSDVRLDKLLDTQWKQ